MRVSTGLPVVLRLLEYGQQTCPACKGEYFTAELHMLRASFEERLREAAKERRTACVLWSVVTAIATAIVCSLLSA
jgi:hypothetical protein